uniref:Heptosyltransferase n=1 Tax=Chlorobium chlorochromatii (strain CaD3) TaxID=340177 RepID=Q3AQJ5_CHLCH
MASKFIQQKRFTRTLVARLLQLLSGKHKQTQHYHGTPKSIIILAQEKLGDSILLTPLLKNLHQLFPQIKIHLVCFSKASATFFKNDSHITAIHQPKIDGLAYYRFIRSHTFDILFNTKDSPSTSFLLQTVLIRAKYKVGHIHQHHTGLFNYEIPINFHSQMAAKNCALFSFLNVQVKPEDCRPYLPANNISKEVATLLSVPHKSNIIGINISTGSPDRQWQEEKWYKLISDFPEQRFIVFAAPNDIASKQRLETLPNVMTTPQTKNIYEVGLLVERLVLLITPDTSLVHVASCYNIPIIGLYTTIEHDLSRFSPYLIDYHIVRSPTNKVEDIALDAVKTTLKKQLEC